MHGDVSRMTGEENGQTVLGARQEMKNVSRTPVRKRCSRDTMKKRRYINSYDAMLHRKRVPGMKARKWERVHWIFPGCHIECGECPKDVKEKVRNVPRMLEIK